MPNDLITVKEAGRLLNVSRQTIYNMIETKKLKRSKNKRGAVRVSRSELLALDEFEIEQ